MALSGPPRLHGYGTDTARSRAFLAAEKAILRHPQATAATGDEDSVGQAPDPQSLVATSTSSVPSRPIILNGAITGRPRSSGSPANPATGALAGPGRRSSSPGAGLSPGREPRVSRDRRWVPQESVRGVYVRPSTNQNTPRTRADRVFADHGPPCYTPDRGLRPPVGALHGVR